MYLKEYFQKRNLKKSGEPISSFKKTTPKHIFVIHKHYASHLHWDLRLQIKGVLKSWAVPKQPPRSRGIKRLAILVEDHPLSYASFEGEIPEGNYGAGKVEIWDEGELNLLESKENKIEFELKGKKLSGKYVLLKAKLGGENKNWLFFKI
jgi:bifunctional non-homologous end joining protein LigD